jgi:hypothetical protein
MNIYIKSKKKNQINDLLLHLKLLEKQGQEKYKKAERNIFQRG